MSVLVLNVFFPSLLFFEGGWDGRPVCQRGYQVCCRLLQVWQGELNFQVVCVCVAVGAFLCNVVTWLLVIDLYMQQIRNQIFVQR